MRIVHSVLSPATVTSEEAFAAQSRLMIDIDDCTIMDAASTEPHALLD